MTSEEHDLINGLFNRLRTADSSNQTPKDQEAVQLIGQLTGQQPSAPYLLVQTLLVQEHALANAQARIHQLEQQAAQAQQQAAQKPAAASGGGFLSGLFGHSASSTPPTQPVQGQMPPPMPQPAYSQAAPPPYPTTVGMAPSAGGGFLKGALGTAAGVAGGALLFQGIENMLGHNAGPFGGGGFGGGGFGGGGSFLGGGYGGRGEEVIENTEVVNNYYNDNGGQGGIPAGVADSPAVPSHEDTRYDDANATVDSGFDSSNPFDKPDNLGLGNDTSSIDNNYDVANTDANDGGLFGGGDTSLGDSSSDFGGGSDDSQV